MPGKTYLAFHLILANIGYDPDRVKAVGPDRACSEWLLRCGAAVRWTNQTTFLHDYNHLPAEGTKTYVEEIDATNSCIMHRGFPHLKGLKHLKKIVLNKAPYVDDACLYQLKCVKETLEVLQVSENGSITDAGLLYLKELKSLQKLLVYGLPGVVEKEKTLRQLREALKDCQIKFNGEDF
ncbi:hypothetical protein QYM36_005244 [Artemia franciscana]|uniref:ATP synthase subunit s, mitochondrial n=1 Tax=Artemia franciscana TaxID=6661 RepID=A0AA88HX02_ARTSF|nr:hypothetical protein QYM36_005244 [Artemia franciscana]